MMSATHHDDLSFDEFDEQVNPRPEETDFDRVVDAAVSRRGLLGGALAFGSMAMLAGPLAATARAASDRFAFTQIAANGLDDITVPQGYTAQVMVRWGDPLWSDVPAFDGPTRGTAATQARAFGDNTDGMEVYAFDGRTLLAVNNEYTNRKILWGNRPEGKAASDDDIAKGMMAHGVTVMEITSKNGAWVSGSRPVASSS